MKSRASSVALIVAVMLALAGCTSSANPTPSTRTLKVVVAFYPFQFIAEKVLGAHGQIENLTSPGAEPHDLELTPRQIADIAGADLVIYQRGFQAAVDTAITQAAPANVIDVATVVQLTTAGDGTNALDPHTWLDPRAMTTITERVRDRVIAIDPSIAADVQASSQLALVALTNLDSAFDSGLATCQRRAFITSHAAFGYLAARYHLEQIGITGLSPDAQPSAARISDIQTIARSRGITTIFYETLVSDAVAKMIANDLGLRTDVLDPLEGITSASRGRDYLEVMTANLTALRTANACQ